MPWTTIAGALTADAGAGGLGADAGERALHVLRRVVHARQEPPLAQHGWMELSWRATAESLVGTCVVRDIPS
eukprot:gene35270-64040_t